MDWQGQGQANENDGGELQSDHTEILRPVAVRVNFSGITLGFTQTTPRQDGCKNRRHFSTILVLLDVRRCWA